MMLLCILFTRHFSFSKELFEVSQIQKLLYRLYIETSNRDKNENHPMESEGNGDQKMMIIITKIELIVYVASYI